MNNNLAITTPSPVVLNNFVYEEFEKREDGALVLVTDKTNIQAIAKRDKTVIIPDNIQLEYPPRFSAKDFVAEILEDEEKEITKSKNKKARSVIRKHTTKSPNKFFIYVKHGLIDTKGAKFQFPMSEISGFIAVKGREESPEVKDHYIKLAEAA